MSIAVLKENFSSAVYGNLGAPIVIRSRLSSGWDFVVAVYSMSLATSSLCLNGIMLGVAYRERKKLRTIDCLIINLAVTDISLALSVFPLFIYSSTSHRWSFGDAGCQYFAFMSFSLGVCSMMTLTEIAIVRYQMVCRPRMVFPNWRSLRRPRLGTAMLMVFPYLHGGLWATGPFWGWGQYDYLPYGTSCSLMWHWDHLAYLICSCVFCLVLPVTMMVFCYAKIVIEKKRSSRSIVRQRACNRRKFSLTTKTLSMCLAFVLAWTPYAIMGVLMMVIPVQDFPMSMFVIPSLCAKASITTNPILHAAMSSGYRQKVRKLFSIGKNKVFRRRKMKQYSSPIELSTVRENMEGFNSPARYAATRIVIVDHSCSDKSDTI